jgi:hypothetical protein
MFFLRLHSEKGVCSTYGGQTAYAATTVSRLVCKKVVLLDIEDSNKYASRT